MNVLCEHGASTVTEVVGILADDVTLAESTVRTLMGTPKEKGYVRTTTRGRAAVYHPLVNQSEARRSVTSYLVDRFFGGSPEELVLNLLKDEELDAVLNGVLQGLLITVGVAAAVRFLGRSSAATRRLRRNVEDDRRVSASDHHLLTKEETMFRYGVNPGVVAGLISVVSLAACVGDLAGPMPPSLLEASIAGSVETEYRGNAVFSTLQRGSTGFFLNSGGIQWSNEGFQFFSGSVPTVGAYTLGQATSEILARYSRREGNLVRQFDADSGELKVTTSSPERWEGTFHFTGRLRSVCDVSRPNSMWCGVVPAGEELEVVTVTGTIDAVPARIPRMIVAP